MSTTTTAPTIDPAPEADAPDAGPPPEKKPGPTFEALAVLGFALSLVAMIVAVFAVGLAARSIDEHRAIADGGGGGGGPVAVSLTEFAIAPAPITAGAGGTIAVTNDGTTTHDLTVEGQDLATATLDAGDSEELDVSSLAAGTYTVFCSIPGHRDSGMETSLTVG